MEINEALEALIKEQAETFAKLENNEIDLKTAKELTKQACKRLKEIKHRFKLSKQKS